MHIFKQAEGDVLLRMSHVTITSLLLVPGYYTPNVDLWENNPQNFEKMETENNTETPANRGDLHLHAVSLAVLEEPISVNSSPGLPRHPC